MRFRACKPLILLIAIGAFRKTWCHVWRHIGLDLWVQTWILWCSDREPPCSFASRNPASAPICKSWRTTAIDGAVRQSVIANLGRADELMASGALASLLASGAKLCDQVLLIHARDQRTKTGFRLSPSASADRCCSAGCGSGSASPTVLGELLKTAPSSLPSSAPCSWPPCTGCSSRARIATARPGWRLRHSGSRWPRPPSLLSRHGVARRRDGGEAGRGAGAALRQGRHRGEAVRTPARSVHRSLRRVHGYDQPVVLRRGRRDAWASTAIRRTSAPISSR